MNSRVNKETRNTDGTVSERIYEKKFHSDLSSHSKLMDLNLFGNIDLNQNLGGQQGI